MFPDKHPRTDGRTDRYTRAFIKLSVATKTYVCIIDPSHKCGHSQRLTLEPAGSCSKSCSSYFIFWDMKRDIFQSLAHIPALRHFDTSVIHPKDTAESKLSLNPCVLYRNNIGEISLCNRPLVSITYTLIYLVRTAKKTLGGNNFERDVSICIHCIFKGSRLEHIRK